MEEKKSESTSATPGDSIDAVLKQLRADSNAAEAIRAKVVDAREEAELAVRGAQREISGAHVKENVEEVAKRALEMLDEAIKALVKVEQQVPKNAYYRYHDMWKRFTQDAVCVSVVANFLIHRKLAGRDCVLGDVVTLPLEDYLYGTCAAVTELSRLCMNRVTVGDFKTSANCATFGAALFEAFKLLNFRNDGLRKRFDGIKYDVKRMEEIMYDLSIRGLLPSNQNIEHTANQQGNVDGVAKEKEQVPDVKMQVDAEVAVNGEDTGK